MNGNVYDNVQYAQDLETLGISTDEILLRDLNDCGFSLNEETGEYIAFFDSNVEDVFIQDLMFTYNVNYGGEFFEEKDGKYYIIPGNEEKLNNVLSILNSGVYDNDDNCKYDVQYASDGSMTFVKKNSVSKEDLIFLAPIYNGEIKMEVSNENNGFSFKMEELVKYFGSEEKALDYINKLGITSYYNNNEIVLQLPDVNSMTGLETVLYNYGYKFNIINNSSSDKYNFYLSNDYIDSNLINMDYKYSGLDDKNEINQIINSYFNDGKIRDLETLTIEDKTYLAKQGIYIYEDKLYDYLFDIPDIEWVQKNNAHVGNFSIAKNSELGEYLLPAIFGDNFYTVEQYNSANNFTNILNYDCSTFLNNNFGLSGLCIFPIDANGIETYYSNIDKYSNSNFAAMYNGHSYIFNNSNEGLLFGKMNSELLTLLSSDTQLFENLGFTMSALINTELDTVKYNNNENKANLKELGITDIKKEDDNSYKVYLSNGQYYLFNKELNVNEYSIYQILSDVNNSDAMKNLNLKNLLLTNSQIESADIDVRTTGDRYEVYINGEIYTINKKDLKIIDANGNIKVSDEVSDEELAKAIFDNIEKNSNNVIADKPKTRNNFVAAGMFTPRIELKDEKYYRKLCTNLNKFNQEIMTYSNSISNINIDSSFINSTGKRNTFCSNIVNVANECVVLSKKIEYCVNLITQCDISLKNTLDKIIDEFFETDFSEQVIRDSDNNGTVESQEYVDFFSTQMKNYKLEIPYYDMLLKGMVEVPSKLMENFKQMGFDLEKCIIKDGEIEIEKYFATKDNVSYFLTARTGKNVFFDQNYSIYNWLAENMPDQIDEDNSLDKLMYNLSMLKLVEDDKDGVVRYRNSLDAFCNTEPYLKYVFSDEYSKTLKSIQEGDTLYFVEDDDVRFVGSEYFTDFQNTILYLATKEEFFKDSMGSPIWTVQDGVKSELEKIVPYSYNQIVGYNEALKDFQKWYEKDGISFGEAFGYDFKNLCEGFFEYGANMLHIFYPETTSGEYKSKYMAEILSSISSCSEQDIVDMFNNGKISEFEKEIRTKMVNEMNGYDPAVVQKQAEVLKLGGQIGSEMLLFYLAINCPNLPAFVKGAAQWGKTTNNVYSQGYSESTATLAGFVSGAITFGLYSKLNTDDNWNKYNKFVKKFEKELKPGVKYNWLNGKFTVDTFKKEYQENVIGIAKSYLESQSMSVSKEYLNMDYQKALEIVNTYGLSLPSSLGSKFADSAFTGVNPISQLFYSGTFDNAAALGANVVLGVDNLYSNISHSNTSHGTYVDYISYSPVINSFGDILNGNLSVADGQFGKYFKEALKTFANQNYK